MYFFLCVVFFRFSLSINHLLVFPYMSGRLSFTIKEVVYKRKHAVSLVSKQIIIIMRYLIHTPSLVLL